MDNTLREIIAQETIKLVLEQSSDSGRVCLKDLQQMKSLFSRICKYMNVQFAKRIEKLEKANKKDSSRASQAVGQLSSAPRSSTTHTVKAGDNYWNLASKYLGNPRRWPEIVSANSSLLSNRPKMPARGMIPGAKGTDEPIPIIRPGDKLTIPPK